MRPGEKELAKKLGRTILAMRLRTYLEETLHAERSTSTVPKKGGRWRPSLPTNGLLGDCPGRQKPHVLSFSPPK
jgi:hypothetical protein